MNLDLAIAGNFPPNPEDSTGGHQVLPHCEECKHLGTLRFVYVHLHTVLTKEHHQEGLDCRDWDYRDPLDLQDQDHPLLDTEEPGQKNKNKKTQTTLHFFLIIILKISQFSFNVPRFFLL